MTTIIGNVITVRDPTPELRQYVKDQLELPNPEYVKKERMGFWTGRTPKTLRLYEWNGNALVLPFGLCRELMPLLQAGKIWNTFTGGTDVDYGKPIPLYEYQSLAVANMVARTYGILKSPAGSGKTMCGLALIQAFGKKALWLCHTADLLNQSKERAEEYMPKSLMGTITEGKVNIGSGITFATVQTMCNIDLERYRHEWDVIVVDECFPANTEILTPTGPVAICDLNPGDAVFALSKRGALKERKVVEVFKRRPGSLVKVRLTNGQEVVCTSNHPLLTERGYICAGHLTSMDSVLCVRENGGHIINGSTTAQQCSSWEKKSFLLRGVRKKLEECMDGRTTGKGKAESDFCQQKDSISADERTEPNERPCGKGNSPQKTEGYEPAPICSRRERTWSHEDSDGHDGRTSRYSAGSGVRNFNEDATRNRIPYVLQSGSGLSGAEDSNRNRRKFSLFHRASAAGCKEGSVFEYVRVESVEVQEQTSDGTYNGMCPDGYVYNLHVSRNHNYFANGINVHNCHNVSASATTVTRYQKVLNNLSARHVIGLTATPYRSDGLEKAMFALIGRVVYEVPKEAVMDKVMQVTVKRVDTEAEITDDCLNVDGTIDFVKLITHLTTDEKRNRLIADFVAMNRGHSCIVLSDRLAQLDEIYRMLPEDLQKKAAIITGRMTSKKGKAERKEAIEKMRTGELSILMASYKLCKEGLDVPVLDRLFMASPVKFVSVVVQSIGRIARVSEGKEPPICYDFVDGRIGYCERAYKTRKRSYRKEGALIDE